MKACFLQWKWVLLYTAFLLSSLNIARGVLDWLADRNLTGLISIALVLAGFGCLVLIIRRIRQVQERISVSSWVRLFAFLALYLVCVVEATSITVERVHFIEYGLLGLLCLQAVGSQYGSARRVAYAVVVGFVIGFIDEVIQGLLLSRYYDLRDVSINLLGVGLPILGLFGAPLLQGRPRRTGTSTRQNPARETHRNLWFRSADAVALVSVLGVLCAMRKISKVEWNEALLTGHWERQNPCGRLERVQINENGSIYWQDAKGNRAVGWYEVGGNRLDGPQLRVQIIRGTGEGPCIWTAGGRINAYFEVDKDRLVFKRRRQFPFKRLNP